MRRAVTAESRRRIHSTISSGSEEAAREPTRCRGAREEADHRSERSAVLPARALRPRVSRARRRAVGSSRRARRRIRGRVIRERRRPGENHLLTIIQRKIETRRLLSRRGPTAIVVAAPRPRARWNKIAFPHERCPRDARSDTQGDNAPRASSITKCCERASCPRPLHAHACTRSVEGAKTLRVPHVGTFVARPFLRPRSFSLPRPLFAHQRCARGLSWRGVLAFRPGFRCFRARSATELGSLLRRLNARRARRRIVQEEDRDK